MKVVVIGMGDVGQGVTDELERSGHEIVAVDVNADRISEIEERLDVATLTGYGANPRVLRQAGVETADLVVCATDSDEVNLVAALASKRLGGGRTVVRLQSGEYEDAEGEEGVQTDLFGIDMVVNSHLLVAQEMVDIARSHGAIDVHPFADGEIELSELQLPATSRVVGVPLTELRFPSRTRIGAIIRGEEVLVPSGQDVLQAGDRVFVFGLTHEIHAVEELLVHGRSATRVVVFGGTLVGEHLSKQLVKTGVRVTLIEEDLQAAQALSVKLPGVSVVHGDGTDLAKLEDEGTGAADLYFAVTDDDENNMMSCLLAKRLGTPQTCCVVHRHAYIELYRQIGIDMAISPRQVAADHILQYALPPQIERLIHLADGAAEVLEVVAALNSRITAGPLHSLRLPRGLSIGGIVGVDGVSIATGDTVVEPGDTVVILNLSAKRPEVDKLFKGRLL